MGWGENFRENPTFYSSLCHQEHSYFSPLKIFYVKHVCIFASTCVLPRVFIFICVSAIVRIRICVFTLHLYFESFILVDWIVLYCKHLFMKTWTFTDPTQNLLLWTLFISRKIKYKAINNSEIHSCFSFVSYFLITQYI